MASFESERDLLVAAQQHWNASSRRAKQVALMWESLQAREHTGKDQPSKTERKLGWFRSSSRLPSYWEQLQSLLSSLAEDARGRLTIGLLNFQEDGAIEHPWDSLTEIRPLVFDLERAGRNLTWNHLYPEWIDEEELYEVPKCPSLPMPTIKSGTTLDVLVAKIPCEKSGDWARDVDRLHLQLAAANIAAKTHSKHVLLLSECLPVPNLFTCRELLARSGDLWLYAVNLPKMRMKLKLPVGSCELAVPLKTKSSPRPVISNANARREAYATILHSADLYVCGAIALAQSIRRTGSRRELVVLVDDNISRENRQGLEAAGWRVEAIERIRNPRAEAESYNEWNYSKLRLWQLARYEKVIFLDADVVVWRNLDFLFHEDEIMATGNARTIFNSGVMVVEPSQCMFELLMSKVEEIVSYNGGDQGFLNEIFTWWHRIPRRMNFLKHFWSSSPEELQEKTQLFSSGMLPSPPLYVLHFLGIKPWLCFRDYDCNWDLPDLRPFASDVAHASWWALHDTLPPRLVARLCALPPNQTIALTEARSLAAELFAQPSPSSSLPDPYLHWQRNISDPRFLYPHLA